MWLRMLVRNHAVSGRPRRHALLAQSTFGAKSSFMDAPTLIGTKETPMSPEENKVIARRFVEEVQNKGNISAIDDFLADNFVNHSVPPGLPPDREGVKQLFTLFRNAFPDFHAEILDQVAEGDEVVTRKTFYGTQEREFLGIPATGKEMSIELIEILRVSDDGKITDHWNVVDQLGMMQQLGVIAA
jgi:steroid delta-isomerase-like uncharacterized protein